jgi:hypothetical protein
MPLIDQEQYFVIHAARQTGKTTLLMELAQDINAAGSYYALYCRPVRFFKPDRSFVFFEGLGRNPRPFLA